MEGLVLEVWFPAQDRVSVFLESSFVDDEDEAIHETMLFALFAARQIANFSGDLVAQSLAAVLTDIDKAAPLKSAAEKLDGVTLVSPSPGRGRKGFTAELRPEKRAFFKLNAHGFGMLGRGVGYYAPTAVLALLAHLLSRRESPEYRSALALAGNLVGIAGRNGAITIPSQANVAMQAAGAAWVTVQDGNRDEESPDSTLSGYDEPDDLEDHESDDELLGLAQALAFGIDIEELAYEVALRMSQLPVEEGKVQIFHTDVISRYCRSHVILAADLADDEFAEAVKLVGTAGEEKLAEAEARLDALQARILATHQLDAAARLLADLTFTSDPDEAMLG